MVERFPSLFFFLFFQMLDRLAVEIEEIETGMRFKRVERFHPCCQYDRVIGASRVAHKLPSLNENFSPLMENQFIPSPTLR